MSKFNNFFLASIIAVFLLLSTALLLDEPQVWPDEAIYGDIARNLMLENRLGTDLWKGFIDGIENHYYSLPPLYLYTSSVWYRLFGFSITTQRLFSVFLGSVFLILYYHVSGKFVLSRNQKVKNLLPIAITLLLAIDPVFLAISRLGRPEILVLVFIMFSILFYLHSIEEKIFTVSQKYLSLTGLFLGFSLITHLIAAGITLAIICAVIYSQRKNLFDYKKYYLFIVGILIPIAGWLLYLYPNYKHLVDQLKLVEASRNYTIPWYINVLNMPLLSKLAYLFYLLLSLFFIIFTVKNKKQPYILLSFSLIFAWIFTSLGKIYWYTIYPVALSYLALVILINQHLKLATGKLRVAFPTWCLILICLFLLCAHIINYSDLTNQYKNDPTYHTFENQISNLVPAGKTVYLSSIPDAYYAFTPGRNRLLEFPALFAGKDKFKKTLNEVDYVVFNGFYTPDVEASKYFDQYLAKNLESVKKLTSPYHILIFKIKDRDLRTDVN